MVIVPQLRVVKIKLIHITNEKLQLLMLFVSEQEPLDASLVVPLAELPYLASHK